jgi:GNAT superfamily N-acetyltransferase
MHSPELVRFPEDLPRFCAAAGHPLSPEAVTRQSPDLSCMIQGAGGQARARCSLWWRSTPALADHKIGYIGHYAVTASPEGSSASTALLAFACERLAAEGRTLAVGPVGGNTWQRYRLLTERGSEPPFFLEPDNPDEWPSQFTASGFIPLAQYFSALNDDLMREDPALADLERRVADHGVTIEALQPECFDEEMRRVHALSLLSFRNNLLYTPISEADFLAQYAPIRRHMRPDLVLLAKKNEELIGYIFGIPDLLQAQRGQPVRTVILKTMAVHPDHGGAGIGGLLMARCHQAARAAGFTRAIHALFHEANRSGRISSHTARVFRRYTLFSRPLRGQP